MGDNDTPKAPQLPPDAPADLKDFLDCKSASVTLKDGTLSWLPLPPEIKDFVPEGVKPDVSIGPGTKAGTATITVKMGVELTLPASVKNGQLTIDTTSPPFWAPQKLIDGIDQAVKDINDWFKHNGKGFGKPAFGNRQVTLSKVDLAPAPGKTPPPPAPPPKPPPPPAPPPTTPAPPATAWGCSWLLILGVLLVGLLGVGVILLFDGNGLGLFGVASPTPTASPTPVASPVPTPTPTPAARVVVSDDGLVRLTIPHDSAPADAAITVSALGQADAPPELAGVTFRSAFYRIKPLDLRLTGPVGFDRTVNLTAQGIDPDKVGYSVTSLALRVSSGSWVWLGDQRSWIGGPDGTAPENLVQQQATLDRFGEVFGFGGTVWAHRDPYPEQVEFAIGTTVRFGVQLTGPDGGAFAAGLAPTITRALKYVSITGTIEGGEPQISVGSDGSPRVDVTGTCRAEGEGVVGVDLTVMQTDTSALLDLLELGPAPDQDLSFRTTMRCVTGVTGFQPVLDMGCVSVIHRRLSGIYPSYLHWLFGFRSDPGFPQNATLDLSYREGASGSAMTFSDIPIVGGKAIADTGITSFGEKLFVESHVKWSDGSTDT